MLTHMHVLSHTCFLNAERQSSVVEHLHEALSFISSTVLHNIFKLFCRINGKEKDGKVEGKKDKTRIF